MKIALLTEKYTPDIGGLAISSERLTQLLSAAGHKVHVFAPTLNLPPSEKRILPSSRVSVTRFGANKRADNTLVDWFELIVEEHKRDPFEVIHAYFLTQAGFVATYTGRYLNIPSVVSIRGNDIEQAPFDPSKFSHTAYTLQNANAITTNASELIKKAKAFVDREIHLIPNGINVDHFKPMERNEALADTLKITTHVIPSKAKNLSNVTRPFSPSLKVQRIATPVPVIGFAGELRKKKGLEAILAAYTQINKRQKITLLIVGEVRQGGDKKLFEEFQLSNPDSKIIVTGQVPHIDLPSYYSLMDVFIHPSLRDGMPNAVLEAMACGKPILATPVGGVKDILEDGKNGIIVNVNDATMLENKLMELLDNTKKQTELGKNARELVINKFSLAKELEENLNVYRSLGLEI